MTDDLKFRQPRIGLDSGEHTAIPTSTESASRNSRRLCGVSSRGREDRNGPAKSRHAAVVSLDMLMVVRVAILLQTWFFV
jgi:hypothetical protein